MSYKLIILCLLFQIQLYAYAQPGNNFDSLIGHKIIFQDDFRSDNPGQFPSGWHLDPCDYFAIAEHPEQFYRIEKDHDQLSMSALNTSQHWKIAPNMHSSNYLPDSFVVEFNFEMSMEQSCSELFLASYSMGH